VILNRENAYNADAVKEEIAKKDGPHCLLFQVHRCTGPSAVLVVPRITVGARAVDVAHAKAAKCYFLIPPPPPLFGAPTVHAHCPSRRPPPSREIHLHLFKRVVRREGGAQTLPPSILPRLLPAHEDTFFPPTNRACSDPAELPAVPPYHMPLLQRGYLPRSLPRAHARRVAIVPPPYSNSS
jgi:hypothetical protein